MFLKEPEKNNCQLINNNDNFQGGLNSSSWMSGSEQQTLANEESDTNIIFKIDKQENKQILEDSCTDKKCFASEQLQENNTTHTNSNGIGFTSLLDGHEISDSQLQNNEEHTHTCENTITDHNDNFNISFENKAEEYETEDIFNYEDSEKSYTSSEATPVDGIYDYDISDSEDSCIQDVDDMNVLPRGIHNPNYPGFQHLAYALQEYSPQLTEVYENAFFSNVYIQCKDEEELLNLTLANQKQTIITNNITESKKEYDFSDDDEGISTKFNDLEDSEYTRDISTDSAIFENRETDISQDDLPLNSPSISTVDEFKPISDGSNEFQDELIALRHEIYDVIQKPLASTIESVSEVINTVIRHIVEYQTKYDIDVWSTLSQEAIYDLTKNLQTEMDAENINKDVSQDTANDNCSFDETSLCDESLNDMETSLNTVDAYITNAKEELFESPDYEKHICSTTYLQPDKAITNFIDKIESTENIDTSELDDNFNNLNSHHDTSKTEDLQLNTEMTNSNSYEIPSIDSKEVAQNIKQTSSKMGGFDVYNIETAMPFIDLDIIENHLRAAREEERRRRNDREEIRRRLALGAELDEFYRSGDRPGKKPSLQTRLQSGMNLQICFMNETASDTDSPSEGEIADGNKKVMKSNCTEGKCEESTVLASKSFKSKQCTYKKDVNEKGVTRPSTLPLNDMARPTISFNFPTRAAFFECQARLQTEARMALAQAKELAHMQMEIERNKREISPITEMLKNSLLKAGVKLTGDRRRVSRQMLTDMNVAQLQVIVNELHTQIEYLNDSLVKLLIARDELHMGQDSMLVDIEDLTRYLSAKEESIKNTGETSPSQGAMKSHITSLSSLLNK